MAKAITDLGSNASSARPDSLQSLVPRRTAERLHPASSGCLPSRLISKYRRAHGASARRRPFPLLLASFFIISQPRIYMMSSLLSPARRDEVRGRYFKEEVEEGTRGVWAWRGFEESAPSATACRSAASKAKS